MHNRNMDLILDKEIFSLSFTVLPNFGICFLLYCKYNTNDMFVKYFIVVILSLYEYVDGDDTNLAGRIIALYGADGAISETLSNPTRVADKVAGAPKMVGLDIIWDMEWDSDDNKYEDGKIMDPKSGKVYSSVMWQDVPAVLNVRGKIGPFGRTQKVEYVGCICIAIRFTIVGHIRMAAPDN